MNQSKCLSLSCFPLLAGLSLSLSPASAEVIFSESFESPVVSGFDDNTVPSSGWVGASNGFGASNRGLFNEFVAWPGTPDFSTPFGEQGYFLNYTNSALTMAQGTLTEPLTEGEVYTVTFNAGVKAGVASSNYLVEFLAFEPGDDNNARKDGQNTRPGTVLASASGPVTTNDLSESGSLTYTPSTGDPHLGKEIGVRLIKSSGSVIYDNLRVIKGHDLAPVPADGVTISGGDVELGWTNDTPNVGADVFVDVWFGTDPVSDFTKVVDEGANVASIIVNAPVADTFYWRVDSYLEGNTAGAPLEGNVFKFYIVDTDGDGFPDSYELANTNPQSNVSLNAGDDLENGGAGDGLTNLQEYQYGTDPNNADTDGDHLEDGAEISGAGLRPATNPLDPDSDDDGLNDDVESNTGLWVGSADTGTNPTDADYDDDGLPDGVETKSGIFVNRKTDTGTDPYLVDTDADGAWDWYEVAATFTDPNSNAETPEVPYPLPDPDGSAGATDKPVKVYILSGQSNMVGIGYADGREPGSMETVLKRDHKFPNMIEGGVYTERNDVYYRGVVSAIGDGPLTVGITGNRVGPEHGFGHIMGWFHDEPVLIIKTSIGNRSIGWDFLPPGSPRVDYTDGNTYAGYGDQDLKWPIAGEPSPVGWYAGKQYDLCFLDEADWAPAGAGDGAVTNAADVLANFATDYPQWAGQGYEIAGFVWWQGHKDQYEEGHHGRYEENLENLIGALRTEFDAPNAPFVVATIGFDGGGYEPGTPYDNIYQAQLAVGDPAQHPEFSGTVASVDTTGYWRELDESPGGQGFHYNNNAETYTLVGDAMGRAMISLLDDVTPPSPDPLSFEITPTAVDESTVGMVVAAAGDPSGPVEYYFENSTNGDNSGWIGDTAWSNTGLAPGSYDYRVKARDGLGNDGMWSAVITASPGADITAPLPDPMSFFVVPVEQGESSITMTAASASDINGVEYYFDCLTVGGNDSGWQDSPVYTDTGLSSGTEYSYAVQARDKSTGQNATGFSAPASATTTEPDLTAPMVDSLSPSNGASEVAIDANLVVTFDEEIMAGSGLITLKNLTDDTETSIDIGDAQISGSMLEIDPVSDLVAGKDYAIQMNGSAVLDFAGNAFGGINDDATWAFATQSPPPVGVLFSENFENPDVGANAGDGDTNKTLPNNGSWVGASQGFGADRRGITDKAGGDFNAADPNMQAFAFRYTNSGLTTSEGVIGDLAGGVTYTVSVDVIRDDGRNAGTGYHVQLIAFGEGARRDDCRTTPSGSTILASSNSNASGDGLWKTVDFEFTAEAGHPDLGEDLGVRFIGATTTAIVDNLVVTSSGGGGGSDYDVWTAGYTGSDLSDPDGDFDKDGRTNNEERLFGTNPTEANSQNAVTLLSGVAETFSYTRRNPSLSGASYSIWTSPDMETWTEDAGALQDDAGSVADIQTVEVTVSPSLMSEEALFFRVVVE
ncbi:Ig-like domain-containing protein [Akkermansiaceae bacterium]|nr:Ig-like domain-containing protein [Akkermansiaceae bacterium]MDB4544727.1 Ig-like domain-containing protein [Akkermansiaceae bacterium]